MKTLLHALKCFLGGVFVMAFLMCATLAVSQEARNAILDLYGQPMLLAIGEDVDLRIGTADQTSPGETSVLADGTAQVTFGDGVLYPVTDNDVDLGTASLEFKDGFFDGTLTLDDLVVSGDITLTGGLVASETVFIPAASGRAGGTATVGFVNTGTDNLMVTLAQSATADTWVIPLQGVGIGDTITGFKVIGQIESAGNTVTVDAALRKETMAAADPADAAFGTACAITQISKTADYEIADSKTACAETVVTGVAPYALLTVTTGATTDVQIAGIELTITKS